MVNFYSPAALDVYRQVNVSYSAAIDAQVQAINKAIKGLGTDEKALAKVFGSVSPNDRTLISYRYKEVYGKDLGAAVESEAGGNYGFLLQLAALPLPEAEAEVLHRATSGAGTTEEAVYPILLGRTAEELAVLKRAFFDKFNQDLAVVLDSELTGDLKTVITTSLQASVVPFKESFHTKDKAKQDADKLYDAGEGKWGTDEDSFIRLLLSSPPEYLQLLNEAYIKKHNRGLIVAVQKEFTGIAESALLYHVRLAIEPNELLADQLESTVAGFGTDEEALAIAVVRFQSLLPQFDSTYQEKYKSTIRDRIKGEVSGDYGDLLLALVDAPKAPPGP